MVIEDPLSDKSDDADANDPLDHFEEWWETYGNKVGRHKSELAFKAALKKPGVTAERLIAATGAYIDWCQSTDTRLKNPLTWLHGEHWRDERKTAPKPQTNTERHMALVRELAEQEQITSPQIGSGR